MKRTAIFFVLLLFFSAIKTARADNPVSLAAYQRAADQALALVKQSQGTILDERPALLQQAAVLLTGVTQVQLDSGETITVHNDALIAELHKTAQDSQHLYLSTTLPARLAALRAALADPPTSASDADLQALRDIFDQPPFKRSDAENLVRQLVRQFNRWLNELFNRSGSTVYDERDFITFAGVLATMLIVALFVIRLRQNLAAEVQLKAGDAENITTSHAALAHAQKFAGAGDYRSAVRMLYLATLLLLDERGKLRYDKSLTNHEYLRAVRDEPLIAAALQPIIETFDRTWYGFEEMDVAQFGEFQDQVEQVKKF